MHNCLENHYLRNFCLYEHNEFICMCRYVCEVPQCTMLEPWPSPRLMVSPRWGCCWSLHGPWQTPAGSDWKHKSGECRFRVQWVGSELVLSSCKRWWQGTTINTHLLYTVSFVYIFWREIRCVWSLWLSRTCVYWGFFWFQWSKTRFPARDQSPRQ